MARRHVMSRKISSFKLFWALALVLGLLAAACGPLDLPGLDESGQAQQAADDNSAGDTSARTDVSASQAAGAEVEFTGVVTSIGADEWVVGAETVRVTPLTEIKAGVALGAVVKVHASPGPDGVLVAREIELAADDDDDDDDDIAGEQEF